MSYLFTSESVSEGHPDKVCDQISDAIVDHLIAADPCSKIACETMVTRGQVVLAGEVLSSADLNVDSLARDVINQIGYTKSAYQFDANSCGILTAIHGQSQDINRGVDRLNPEEQGAGDQGMMFGYATDETPDYMPLTLDLSNSILMVLADIRKNNPEIMPYLRPDAKSQVTIEYNDSNIPVAIRTIVLSTQHDEFILPKDNTEEAQQKADEQMRLKIEEDVRNIILPRAFKNYQSQYASLFENGYDLLVNPTGKFVIGGPAGDTGLTGRKIIVDTYGGRSSHGGGAFSGKDPSKVDRSAAYAARHIAKNMVAAGVAKEMRVQVAYAIGVAAPVSVNIDTNGTAFVNLTDQEIAHKLQEIFDLRPYSIERRLALRNPIYQETAVYGHFGRKPKKVKKVFKHLYGQTIEKEVELFTWEKLDYVDKIKEAFSL